MPWENPVVNFPGQLGIQNLFHIPLKQIAQGNFSVRIQAAGNYRAVAKHTNLIPQSVAEISALIFRRFQRGPVEFIPIFQIDLVPNPGAPGLFFPVSGEELGHSLQNLLVTLRLATLVPKPINCDFLPAGRLTIGKAVL